jgi:hypothetical protein
VELTGESFARDPGFDIDQHGQKAVGAFQNDSEYGEVVWKIGDGVQKKRPQRWKELRPSRSYRAGVPIGTIQNIPNDSLPAAGFAVWRVASV